MSTVIDSVRDVLDIASGIIHVAYRGIPSGAVKDAVTGADMVLRGIVIAMDEQGVTPREILQAIAKIKKWDPEKEDLDVDRELAKLPSRDKG